MTRPYSTNYRPSVERECPVCGKTFHTYEAWIKRGGGKTCSHECANRLRSERRRPLDDRLWERVDQSGGENACWEFIGARHRFGYGKIGIAGEGPRDAHRVAWEVTRGPIPNGMEVCHSCDNPPCCNPAHLFLGTRKENAHDAMRKGRTTIGERNPMAKLTWKDVADIRARHASGETRKSIARHYGVSPATISNIYKRITWNREDTA